MSAAFRAIPAAEQIEAALALAYQTALPLDSGQNASYIPSLAQVAPELFGISVTTVDGQHFEIGDSSYQFAIESISKVLSMVLVMEEQGAATLHAKVGASSTGLPFNSVLALELHEGKPMSPLVNAGAMSTISLLQASSPEERWDKLLGWTSYFAGRPLKLMEETYQSEAASNFHNRGIAWLLYSYGTLYCDPLEACDVYTRHCSLGVTANDLALMAATMANGGLRPGTQERICQREHVPQILAEMTMEGLYDASGDWAYHVGLPSKSGVGGGIMAVMPGVLGIAAFSPRLDPQGNSVRAAHAIRTVAQVLGLNVYAV